MRSPPRHAPSHGLAHAARAWLFCLALILVAAHSVATWHVYTHSIGEAAGAPADKQRVSDPCGLCIAVAGIAGASGEPPVLRMTQFAHEQPPGLGVCVLPPAPQRAPYAIRAPPFFA
jgi:hypothetical protein